MASSSQLNIEMLIRLQQGEKKAFESIYWKYSAWIYNFAYSLLQDQSAAEDLTQTVFLKIWEYHANIQPDEPFESYIFSIARHLVYKETGNRLLAERLLEQLQQRAEADSDTEEQIESESLRLYINSLVDQLPPMRRKVYLMSREQQLSYKEIADRMSISEKTVETHIHRTLQFLKQKLTDDNGLLLLFAFSFIR